MINKAILIGRVGKDPEVRTTTNSKVASFSLATTDKYKDKETTQWHNCVVWAKLADVVEQYVKKGQLLYLEGKIEYRSYDDKDGNKKYITEIVVMNLQMLGKKENTTGTISDPDELPY